MGKKEDSLEFVPDRKGHDARYSVSYKKIESELGYEPCDDFGEKIDDVITWYKNHPDRWSAT